MTDEHLDHPSNLWAIHSARENRPVFRDWAPSEAEAQKKLEALRDREKNHPEEEYWVARMSQDEVRSFKTSGVIPPDV